VESTGDTGRDTKKQKTAVIPFEENEPPKNNSSAGAQSNISEFPEEERKPATTSTAEDLQRGREGGGRPNAEGEPDQKAVTTSTTGSETQRKVFRGRKSAREAARQFLSYPRRKVFHLKD
jgi:hypothetical protein